ncbi:type II secretion system protein [Thalassotalea sediminis]|uniref:type II secretion system protein n=1 Tax=Thalassotalea sediminis TaxID=1759089 RepID=UPI003305CB95
MMSHFRKFKGFSLIELVVVMAIMSVIMGLTGALLTKSVSQHKKQVEIEKVRQLFKQLGYKAFYNGNTIRVELRENIFEIIQLDNSEIISFEELTFVPNSFHINTSAVVTPQTFSIISDDKISFFTIKGIYKKYDKEKS